MERQWVVSKKSRNVVEVKVQIKRNQEWEFPVLLSSDRHWDNPKSLLDLQKEHLDQAKKADAPVLDFGDLFCMMQGKYDKRSSKQDIRPEHQVSNYFDTVINDAANFFKPYAKQLVVLGEGNHETAVTKAHEINPIERLVALLNTVEGASVSNGGYSGWVIFNFYEPGGTKSGPRTRVVLHYDHGSGGGAAITKDMIGHSRRQLYIDADIICSGHNHHAWSDEAVRLKVSTTGQVQRSIITHIKIPTYKDDYGDGYGGFAVERNMAPRPLGAYWLRFKFSSKHNKVFYEVVRAT